MRNSPAYSRSVIVRCRLMRPKITGFRRTDNLESYADSTIALPEPHSRCWQICGQCVQNLAPASARLVKPLREHVVVGQREFASSREWFDVDGHAGDLLGVFRHGKGEDKPMRAVDFKVGANMLDVLAVTAIGKVECTADSSGDLDTHH